MVQTTKGTRNKKDGFVMEKSGNTFIPRKRAKGQVPFKNKTNNTTKKPKVATLETNMKHRKMNVPSGN